MILCDASPLVALVLPKEREHSWCRDQWRSFKEPLTTSWLCFGEAMHLVGSARHEVLWAYAEQKALRFFEPTPHAQRMRQLMVKYADTPMDLADASLVVAAEALEVTRVFTLDSDFYHYRIHDRTPFDVIR